MVSIERRWKDYCELKQKKSELERNLGETLTKEIDKLDKQKGRVSGWTIFSGIVIGSYILKNGELNTEKDIDAEVIERGRAARNRRRNSFTR